MDKTLILVDIQYDFLEGGSLAVPGADTAYVEAIERIRLLFDQVLLTADSHPAGHVSFSVFPPHCVIGTHGADLAVSRGEWLLLKGQKLERDEFSAFGGGANIDRITGDNVYVVGLAGDFCVKATILDLLRYAPDKQVFAIVDLIKSVDGTTYGSVDYFDGAVGFIHSEHLLHESRFSSST